VRDISDNNPFIGLVFILVVSAYAFLEGTVMAIEVPNIVRDLQISTGTANLAMTLLIATSAAVLVAVGRIADQFGRRRMILGGIILAIVSSILMATAWDAASLLFARVTQGVATAMILTSVALLKGMFSEEDRPRAFALFGASMGLGLALAPIVGSLALEVGSWRVAFWINIPILAVAYAGILRYVPESRAQGVAVPVDVVGTILLGTGLLLAITGISEGASMGWWASRADNPFAVTGLPISIIPILLATSIVVLAAFAYVERARLAAGKAILMNPGLLRIQAFRLGCGVSFLFVLGGYSLQFLMPICGATIMHLGVGHTSLLTAMIGVGIVAGGYSSAPLGLRISPRSIVIVGLLIMMLGILSLGATLGPNSDLFIATVCCLAIGIGYGLTYSRITEITLIGVPNDSMGLASGMLVASRTCAMAFAAAALTAILWNNSGTALGPHLLDVHIALGLCIVMLAAALILALRLGTQSNRLLGSNPTSERSAI
jgi:MFS family permease